MSEEQLWGIAVAVLILLAIGLTKAIGKGVRWIAREIGEHVVDSIGDTLSARWNADMQDALDEALEPITFQLSTNGGDSLRDKVNEIDTRLDDIESQLEGEGLFRPRRRPYSEDDAYPA